MSITTINGLGQVTIGNQEYTSPTVISDYLTLMNTLNTVMNTTATSSNSAQLYSEVTAAITGLQDLATNGASNDPNLPGTFYMSGSMATAAGQVIQSLDAVGITATSPAPTDPTVAIQNWQVLASFGVQTVLTNAVTTDVIGAAQSLQSMIELDFVAEGNQYLNQSLSTLETQIQNSEDVLNSLTIAQNVINEVTTTTPTNFAFPPTNSSDIPSTAVAALAALFPGIFGIGPLQLDYSSDVSAAQSYRLANPTVSFQSALALQSKASSFITSQVTNNSDLFVRAYQIAASAHFSQVFPTATPTANAASSILAVKTQLINELTSIESSNPSVNRTTINSLPYFIYQVAQDISAHFLGLTNASSQAALTSAVKAYIIDNQNQKLDSTNGFTAGSIQTDVTNAISAAQNLNNSQQAQVNNAEFIFQSFYTSASNVLQNITQIIQSFAQGINSQ